MGQTAGVTDEREEGEERREREYRSARSVERIMGGVMDVSLHSHVTRIIWPTIMASFGGDGV